MRMILRGHASKCKIFDVDSATIESEECLSILSRPAYKALSSDGKARVAKVVQFAIAHPDKRAYYLQKLKLLQDTEESREPEAKAPPPRSTGTANESVGSEEIEAALPTRRWTRVRSSFAKSYLVDKSDLSHIVMRFRVKVDASANLRAPVIAREDDAEKHLKTPGLTVDLEFTDETGDDVFEVGAGRPHPTTSNWTPDYRAMGHELGHFGSLDDYYDYIESHAGNPRLSREYRLDLFTQQLTSSCRQTSRAASCSPALTNRTLAMFASWPRRLSLRVWPRRNVRPLPKISSTHAYPHEAVIRAERRP